MKRLLLQLIATLSLTTAVSAASVWLTILHSSGNTNGKLAQIEIQSIQQCRGEGEGEDFVLRWFSSRNKNYQKVLSYKCITGIWM